MIILPCRHDNSLTLSCPIDHDNVALWHYSTNEIFYPAPTTSSQQFLNDIFGNRLVYTDTRNAANNNDGNNYDIFMYTFTETNGGGTPPTSAQAIQQLINLAQSLCVNIGPLHQAVDLVSDTNPNNDRAVCNQLDAFINQVNTNLQQQGQIIPEQEANQLISSAQSIKLTIGCSS